MPSDRIPSGGDSRDAPRRQVRRVLFSPHMLPLRSLWRLTAALLLLIGAIGLAGQTGALAQTENADRPIPFDIPAQPLDAALAQYFSVTGVQLLYDSELAAGHRSMRVSGTYTPRDALRRLLSGTGLIVRYSRTDAATITRPGTSTQPPLVPLGRVIVRERVVTTRFLSIERLAYYGQLEGELQDLLVSSERTGRLNFNVVVHLQVSDDGRLSDVDIRRSSGNRRTDALVTETLQQATVTPPPDGLEQPLAVALRGATRADQRR
ncbi:MAG: hypothetical protein CVT77_03350 [Alphaproteobacteria bacterium HGW-Alphaproteobacteria-16]|nr:MAG: hypothetical protein CVT77_03350 [Alphaproteobacteria bacterium HGW-Alphaproteobacteria-16]